MAAVRAAISNQTRCTGQPLMRKGLYNSQESYQAKPPAQNKLITKVAADTATDQATIVLSPAFCEVNTADKLPRIDVLRQ